MKKIATVLIISLLYCNSSFAVDWKVKNKWKVSCGIADKESLIVNGVWIKKNKTNVEMNFFINLDMGIFYIY